MQRHPHFAVRTTLAIIVAVGGATLASGACGGDTTGPNNLAPIAVAVGDTISGALHGAGDTLRTYSVNVQANQYYAVFLQATTGIVTVRVGYSGFIAPLATVSAAPGLAITQRATGPFWAHVAGTMEIRVTSTVSGPDAQFRFVVAPIDAAPEHRAALAQLGDTVVESLETIADLDTFAIAGQAGQRAIAVVQALAPPGTGSVRVEVLDDGSSLASVTSTGQDSILSDQVSGPFTFPASRQYTITVQANHGVYAADPVYQGAYRVQVVALDSAPELASAQVTIGDTVVEAINPVGDVDEYTFSGTAGQEFNLFFQALSGSGSDLLHADVLGVAGTYSVGSDTSLLRQHTGRFTLPTTGTFKIRIYGDYDGFGGDRGRYRFALYPVNRRPESGRDTLALGDSVLGERIDFPGDVDEYHVIVPDSSGATVQVQLGADATGGMVVVSLLDSAGRSMTGATADSTGKYSFNTAVVGPGSYLLRVEGFDGPLMLPGSFIGGSYRLWLFPFRETPELTPDTIAIGDTIAGESLYPLGDIDHYVFFGKKGDHFSFELQGVAPPGPGGMNALLTDGSSIFYTVASPEAGDSLGGYQTNRIDLDHSGWYQVTISGGSPPPRSGPEPYRFALTRRNTTPEVASSALTFGDSVTGEALDYPGDWDQYTLTGPPGQKMVVLGQTMGANGYPTLTIFDSTTGATSAEMLLQAIATVTDTFSIPAGGQLQIAVRQPRGIGSYYCFDATCGGSLGITGAYRLVTLPFNAAPESVPATFALGDTVRGEPLSPAGDVDEFTSSATPGDSLVEWFRLTAATNPPGGEISMQVIDPATGAVLAGLGASMNAATAYFVSPGAFKVPASGNYKVRVLQYNPVGGAAAATAQYEFYLARAP